MSAFEKSADVCVGAVFSNRNLFAGFLYSADMVPVTHSGIFAIVHSTPEHNTEENANFTGVLETMKRIIDF